MYALLFIFPVLFLSDSNTQEFLNQVAVEKEMGAEWHYVGKQPLDPTAKSLPAQVCDPDGTKCGEPYIMWKLKIAKDGSN